MPVALFLIGAIFLTAAVRGKQDLLFSTLKDDFTGPNNFFYWALAIFIIAMLGNYKPLRPISNAFMVLVFLALFLSHRGFFNRFMEQMGATRRPSFRGGSSEHKAAIKLAGAAAGLEVIFE